MEPIYIRHFRYSRLRTYAGELQLAKPPDEIMGNGGITVAVGMSESMMFYKVAVSRCHISDNFNKKIGFARATGLLKSKKEAFDVDPKICIDSKGDVDYERISNFCERLSSSIILFNKTPIKELVEEAHRER